MNKKCGTLTVREVKSRRDAKRFIDFPLRLYKGVSSFTPPLYMDERKLIKAGGKPECGKSVFFIAEREGKTVGRIQGIIQDDYNKLHGTREVRFTRFDAIDDKEVARELISAVEEWGKQNGMTELVGPLGYSDLDREGLLVFGFDEESTFEEQYNYGYYEELLLGTGLMPDAEWVEFELRAPKERNPMLRCVAERTLELNGLHIASTDISKRSYIKKYRDGFFECLDRCYAKLYGTAPISKEMQDELIAQFMLIINKKYLIIVCDKDENVVAFGLCFPSIRGAVKPNGKINPISAIKLISAVRRPKTVDLGLIAVLPEYQNTGINAVILNCLTDMLFEGGVEKCETNLNLSTNTAVISQWKHFDSRLHKRRRAYRKQLL